MDQRHPLPRIILSDSTYLQANLKPSKRKSRQLFLAGGFNLRGERGSNPSASDILTTTTSIQLLEFQAPVQTAKEAYTQGGLHDEL